MGDPFVAGIALRDKFASDILAHGNVLEVGGQILRRAERTMARDKDRRAKSRYILERLAQSGGVALIEIRVATDKQQVCHEQDAAVPHQQNGVAARVAVLERESSQRCRTSHGSKGGGRT